jgi:hypothetical protein
MQVATSLHDCSPCLRRPQQRLSVLHWSTAVAEGNTKTRTFTAFMSKILEPASVEASTGGKFLITTVAIVEDCLYATRVECRSMSCISCA